jgi:hypothetical protein
MKAGSIVVAGALAQKPRHGGHAWVLLQYLLGFKRIGWDVLFVDRLAVGPPPVEAELLAAFLRVVRGFGLDESFALLRDGSCDTIGLTRATLADRVRGAALLLNVMGFLNDEEILSLSPKRVFLDIDPGFPQMWRELGLHDAFAGHDAFVTIGINIGQPECGIPACGLNWITTPQPVVLERWPVTDFDAGRPFTSVVTWRGAYGPLEYRGRSYGLRVHEFRKFAALPCSSGLPFELALDIDSSETSDIELLRRGGWSLKDPRSVACDPWTYQAFVGASAAEFSVAKSMYVATDSGWFSDRSICYLASGKPVLAQDTGFSRHCAAGSGLIVFSTLEEAVAGAQNIAADYGRHARAARELAEECFDSDKVLRRLLAKLGVQ